MRRLMAARGVQVRIRRWRAGGSDGADPTVFLCQTKHVEEGEVAGHPCHIHKNLQEESQTLTGRRKSLCLVLHEGDKGERKMSAGEEVVGDGAH